MPAGPPETLPPGPPLPDLGPRLPRRGNRFSRWLGRTALRLTGWRLVGDLPDLPKLLVVAAPHTSNWDGFLAIAALLAMGLDAHFMAKHSLFRPPLGWFLRWIGGVPVDRRVRGGVVGQMTERFAAQDRYVLGVTPEGTRDRVEG
ncbi:MAG: 1-acyl-sn-glycerol-3-phosphate acyltransferase, partial [Rhodothermales bacterium]|nr:1-acyl-sn-glycerol-3-phosphate acyltransferase [Rhodothermales bacterium]